VSFASHIVLAPMLSSRSVAVLVLALVGASDALRVGTLGRRAVVQQSVAAAAVSIVFPTGSAHAVQEASKEA